MAIRDIFSKRQQRLRGEVPDVYQYSDLPRPFRAQVVHIWEDAFGTSLERGVRPKDIYKRIHDQVCREYGWFALSADAPPMDRRIGVIQFLLDTEDTEKALDLVETGFKIIDTTCRDEDFRETARPKMGADAAIRELNTRFREHGIGYQFEAGQLVRLDATAVHEEIVRPVLRLLSGRRYAGANAEYLTAHEHYRRRRHKESLSESLKAFESVLKVICQKRGWPYQPTDPAKRLIDICFDHQLVPQYMQSQFSALRSLLESGVPTLRNKLAGHGQGAEPQSVPAHVAAYGLQLAASAILFITACEKDLP